MDNANRRAYLAKYGAAKADTRMSTAAAVSIVAEASGRVVVPQQAFDCVAPDATAVTAFVTTLMRAACANRRLTAITCVRCKGSGCGCGCVGVWVCGRVGVCGCVGCGTWRPAAVEGGGAGAAPAACVS